MMEMVRIPEHRRKHAAITMLVLLLIGVVYWWSYSWNFTPKTPPVYGVTFSKPHTENLGLDWRETFTAILDDLQVRNFRLSAYWNDTEWPDDTYRFDDLDWQINQVRAKNGKVVLAIGRRLPRWPECHVPEWAKPLSEAQQQEQILELLTAVVTHYKHDPVVTAWQVENEPLLDFFGECPEPDHAFLQREIDLVRLLDNRPIITTASGEFSNWSATGREADLLGVSLYRTVWNEKTGHITYPVSPPFYAFRQWYVRRQGVKAIFLSELQGEPWAPVALTQLSRNESTELMNPQMFHEIVDYARRSGFSTIYFWGVEWWYQQKKSGAPEMWDAATRYFH